MNVSATGLPSPGDLGAEPWDAVAPRERDEEAGSAIDLRMVVAAFRRNLPHVLAILVMALLLGLASIFLSTPLYRAVASVQIDDRASRVLASEEAEPAATGAEADRFLQTQVDVLESRALAIRVAQDLRLFNNAHFVRAMGTAPVAGDPSRARDQVLGLLQRNLHVLLPRNSRVVQIRFDSRDPAVAATIANGYSAAFLTGNLHRRAAASQYSRDFLERQLAETKTRLEQSERALIAYARSAGLIDASAGGAGAAKGGAEGPRSLVTANLVDLNQAYAAARANRIQAEGRWTEARAVPLMSLPEVLGNPAVQELTQRAAELKGELEQARQRLKPDHPTIKQQQAQIAALDGQIATLADGLLASLHNQFRIADKQERTLHATLEALKSQTLGEQSRGIRYTIIKREVETNRQLYDGLLQRYKEVSAEAGITSNNITVVDTAEAPGRPIRPRPLLNLALALSAGATLAAAFVLFRERLDDRIRGPRDVGMKLGMPLLGVVPLVPARQRPLLALDDPRSPLNEAHHAIRTALELASDQGLPGTILVTSSRPSEGKSTTAFALGRDLAGSGRRVLLIDADLRKPSLHRLVRQENGDGLSTVLARRSAADGAVRATDIAGLHFLPSGPLPPDPAQLLGGPMLPEVLGSLARAYDAVVIDAPPLLALSDAVRLASNAQATVFVVEANGARFGATRHALARLRGARAFVAGAILTKYDARRDAYGGTDYAGGDYGPYGYGDDR